MKSLQTKSYLKKQKVRVLIIGYVLIITNRSKYVKSVIFLMNVTQSSLLVKMKKTVTAVPNQERKVVHTFLQENRCRIFLSRK